MYRSCMFQEERGTTRKQESQFIQVSKGKMRECKSSSPMQSINVRDNQRRWVIFDDTREFARQIVCPAKFCEAQTLVKKSKKTHQIPYDTLRKMKIKC